MLRIPQTKKILRQLNCWIEISRQRHELKVHSYYLTKDIGISHASLEHEANRAFWETKPLPSGKQYTLSDVRSKDLYKCLDR